MIQLEPTEARLLRKASYAYELEMETCRKMQRVIEEREGTAHAALREEGAYVLKIHGVDANTVSRWGLEDGDRLSVDYAPPQNGGQQGVGHAPLQEQPAPRIRLLPDVPEPAPIEEPAEQVFDIACRSCTEAGPDTGHPFMHAPPECEA